MSRIANVARVLAGIDAVKRTRAYYQLLGDLFEAASQGSGHYNLGLWEQDGIGWTEAQLALVDEVARHLPTSGALLDIGCGVGGPALHLAGLHEGLDVTGVNVVEDHLERARQRGSERVHFLWADADELPFQDGTFDGAFAIDMAFHVRDRRQFVQQARKCIRPGAPLVFTDVVRRPESRELFDRVVLRLAEKGMGSPGLGTAEEWRHDMAGNGFADVEVEDLWPRLVPGLTRGAEMLEGTLMPSTYPSPLLKLAARALRYAAARGEHSPLGYVLVRGRRTE